MLRKSLANGLSLGKDNRTVLTGTQRNSTISPSSEMQHSGTVPSVTNPEPLKKGRRKLNKAIFDVDTAAALRTKAQPGLSIIETKGPLSSGVTVQEATGAVHPPDPLTEGHPKGAPVEHEPGVGNLAEEPQDQIKDVSCHDRWSTVFH